ncbi:MAG: hypothetical protein HN757_07040 [Calditrichaeota bacterium]|jgi:hypothetical protein|nr:hypothetical protein [Calditrichota bacterium]
MSNITKPDIKNYLETQSSSINTFRTLILFGRNTATYKFAFCDALLKLNPANEIRYDDLRDNFMKELVSHYKDNRNQFNSGPTNLTKAMDNFLLSSPDESEWQKLMKVAEKSIYNNVFDAFQNVGHGTLDKKYRLFEHHPQQHKLILTDHANTLLDQPEIKTLLINENQSRWTIVEEAWRAGLSPNLLEYNEEDNSFISISREMRVNVRSAVDVLVPYQKDLCFYCNKKLNRFALKNEHSFPDVDHFLPWSLLVYSPSISINPNGVWNLVIACAECNRGTMGKFDAPPSKNYYKKLRERNVLFAEEHNHSLKNSILISLNVGSKSQVGAKMDKLYQLFEHIKGWEPKQVFPVEESIELS